MDCARADVESVMEFLDRLGAESVSIAARGDSPLYRDDPAAPEYWGQCRLQALFPIDAEPDILIACLRNRLGAVRAESIRIDELGDQDWSASGRAGLEPLLFGDQLCVCPSWVSAPPGRQVLTLDPGLGFGTGSHPTTALCLDWLAARDLKGCALIDYGCGSGILGLSAALLGAEEVWLVDIDAQALAASRVNAERNQLLDRVHFLAPGAMPSRPADLLVANILLNPLLELAPQFARLVRPGASLALSGLLATQATDCLAACAPWFSMGSMTFRNEWALVQGRRRSTAAAG
jgi:ribosomal protein L11 methyltransferase